MNKDTESAGTPVAAESTVKPATTGLGSILNYLGANVLCALIGLLMQKFWALTLTPAEASMTMAYVAVCEWVVLASCCGIPDYILYVLNRFPDTDRRSLFSTQLVMMMVVTAVSGGIFLSLPRAVSEDLPGATWFLAAVVMLHISGRFGTFLFPALGQHRKAGLILASGTAAGALAGLALTGWFGAGMYGRIAMLIPPMAIYLVAITATLRPHFSLRSFSPDVLKQAFRFGWPLMAGVLAAAVVRTSDRALTNELCGKDEAGMFAMAASIVAIPALLMNSAYPVIWQKYCQDRNAREPDKTIRIMLFRWFVVISGVVACVSVLAPEFIWVFLSSKWMPGAIFLPLLLLRLLGFLYGEFLTFDLHFNGRTKVVSALTVTGAVAVVVLNVILLPRIGPLGAGISAAVVSVAIAAGAYGFVSPEGRAVVPVRHCLYLGGAAALAAGGALIRLSGPVSPLRCVSATIVVAAAAAAGLWVARSFARTHGVALSDLIGLRTMKSMLRKPAR